MPGGGSFDAQPDADASDRDTHPDEDVTVTPDERCQRTSLEELGVGVSKICPPDHHGDSEPGHSSGHRPRRPLLLGHAARDGDDRLATEDEREASVALGDMTDIECSLGNG